MRSACTDFRIVTACVSALSTVAASSASLGASGLVLAVELVEVVEQLAQRGRKVLAVRRLADMRLVGLAGDGHGQVILEEVSTLARVARLDSLPVDRRD